MNALPHRSAWLLLLVFAVSDAAGQTPRTDALGDPLPEGAVLRFGSTRLRHAGPIRSIVFSSDGKLLATADGQSVRLWEVATGKLIRSFSAKYPGALAFAPDGKTLAIGSGDHVSLCNVTSGTEQLRFKSGREQYWFVFTGDGKKLLVNHDLGVTLWDLRAQKPLIDYKSESRQYGVVLTPDDKTVISAVIGSGKSRISFFKIDESKPVRSQEIPVEKGLPSEPYGLAITRDGKCLAIATIGMIWLLDPASGAELGRITQVDRYGVGFSGRLAFSPDGKTLALASNGGAIRLFHVAARKEKMRLDGAVGWPQPVTFSPDGKIVAFGGSDGVVRQWDSTTGKEQLSQVGHRGAVEALALSPDGTQLVTSGSDAKDLPLEYRNRCVAVLA